MKNLEKKAAKARADFDYQLDVLAFAVVRARADIEGAGEMLRDGIFSALAMRVQQVRAAATKCLDVKKPCD